MIPTTAAASDALDDNEPQAHSTSMLSEDTTPETMAAFLQEWNTFYQEFIQSPTYQAATSMPRLFDMGVINNKVVKPLQTQHSDVSDTDDNEQPWSLSYSTIMEDITPETKATFLQEWNTFYQEFI